ncbi:MAG: 2-oxo-4-hydroxy-4-carboxy-5-ureidoimidazoline decarboxylase [Verrucomicrobiota bacterium]|jgi:OHCU decarboxylase
MVNVEQLNALDRHEFVRTLTPVFEHSPWIAARAQSKQPFANRAELHAALCDTVMKASDDEKLCLIRAHPDLVGNATLTSESQSEQAAAGLGNLSPNEVAQFQKYNAAYRDRFEFPFVICARENKKDAILSAFPRRLQNSRGQEIEIALREIFKIAELRLKDLVE